jgi:hypothetical protein
MRIPSTLLLLTLALPAAALAQVSLCPGAPLTATWIDTVKTAVLTHLARASNGSVYRTHPIDPAEPDPTPNRITLYADHTYDLANFPPGTLVARSILTNRYRLDVFQRRYRDDPDADHANGQVHTLPLGIKQSEGHTLYGHTTDFLSSKGTHRVTEYWESADLAAQYSEQAAMPETNSQRAAILTDIQRTEPDPALFQIPPGYTLRDTKASTSSQP